MPVAGRDARVAAADWEEEGTKAAVGDTLAFPNQQSHPNKNTFKTIEVRLVGGPSGLLTSSFTPFGRSGRVTHAGN